MLQICASLLYLRNKSPRHNPQMIESLDSVGEPLILTPLLESRRFSEARQRSSVAPLLKNIISNAGYFTVEPKYNSNLFFWFFRAKDGKWQNAPLIVWLQGGPGCSSMFGIFGEHGPFFVPKGKPIQRKYAWTNVYNVLYIDQPVGTGYSFTNSSKGYINSQEMVADHLYKALAQFYQLYSELKKSKLYITGESFAGKFIPAIAYKIHKLKEAQKCNFNLRGLFIVSAFFHPINTIRYSDLVYKIGLVDLQTKNNMTILENAAVSYTRSGLYKMAIDKWDEIVEEMCKNTKFSLYDYTKEIFYGDERYLDYLQSNDIRQKIHVGNTSYKICSEEVYEAFLEEIMQSAKWQIEELLEHYPIAFIGGQFDIITAYSRVSKTLRELQWSGAFQFSQAKRQFLYDGDRVVGYFKSAGNLKDIFIRRASHMIPANQPKITLNVLQKFIDEKL